MPNTGSGEIVILLLLLLLMAVVVFVFVAGAVYMGTRLAARGQRG